MTAAAPPDEHTNSFHPIHAELLDTLITDVERSTTAGIDGAISATVAAINQVAAALANTDAEERRQTGRGLSRPMWLHAAQRHLHNVRAGLNAAEALLGDHRKRPPHPKPVPTSAPMPPANPHPEVTTVTDTLATSNGQLRPSEPLDPGIFAGIHDPTVLQRYVEILANLMRDADEMIFNGAEAMQVEPDEVKGMQQLRNQIIDRRRRNALDRLAQLAEFEQSRIPVVLDPADLSAIESAQGQPLTAVITASPQVPTQGLSSATVWMPPDHAAKAHVHYTTDVGVVVVYGHAVTVYWDQQNVRHELHQGPFQHLFIPRGVPHAAFNRGRLPVVALEFRSNPQFDADNTCLPTLQPTVRGEHPDAVQSDAA